jgi:hypothetical protein
MDKLNIMPTTSIQLQFQLKNILQSFIIMYQFTVVFYFLYILKLYFSCEYILTWNNFLLLVILFLLAISFLFVLHFGYLWLNFFFLIIFDKLVINNKQLSYVKYIYIRKNTTNKMKKLKNTNDILFVSIKQNFLS